MKKTTFVKRLALLLTAALLLPMAASGCQSAQDIIKQRERADEVSKQAEAYMLEKYNRGFTVGKCEAAAGDEYEGDYLITFNGGIHAFYDSDEELFYDDRQSASINEQIMREIWLPMFEDFHVLYDNLTDQSQTFNMVYYEKRGGTETKYSMYHELYEVSAKYYGVHSKLFVNTENIIILPGSQKECMDVYARINETIEAYFKGQKKGDLNLYAVTSELHSKRDFSPAEVDETTQGCMAHIHFGAKRYCATPKFVKVTDGLYGTVCCLHNMSFYNELIELVPVENSENVKKSIVEKMDSQEIGLIDKYTGKKRDIDFGDAIYTVRITKKINQSAWKDVTLAFMMKDSDDPIESYAEMNEQERGFFAYNMNGKEFNATCLCSPNSRSVMFHYNVGDEVYFWFGSQK